MLPRHSRDVQLGMPPDHLLANSMKPPRVAPGLPDALGPRHPTIADPLAAASVPVVGAWTQGFSSTGIIWDNNMQQAHYVSTTMTHIKASFKHAGLRKKQLYCEYHAFCQFQEWCIGGSGLRMSSHVAPCPRSV